MELRMPELPEVGAPDTEDASAKDYVAEVLEEQGLSPLVGVLREVLRARAIEEYVESPR